MLERADKTSRILDVKYFILLRSVEDVGTPFDDVQWAAVLRSASAFEMYRKRHGRISPKGVVEFLLLDREFPRAIQLLPVGRARDSLHAISGTPAGHVPASRRRNCLASSARTSPSPAWTRSSDAGLHEYLDDLQTKMNQVGTGIHDTFFAFKTPKIARVGRQTSTGPAHRQQTQQAPLHETHRHPDRGRRHPGPQRHHPRRGRARQPAQGRNRRPDQRLQQPVQPPRAACPCSTRCYQEIPELDPTKGGTLIGSSRDYVDPNDHAKLDQIVDRLKQLWHRGPDLRRRRRHAQRPAAPRRTPAHRARAQDHRQRSGPELSERARRMGPRATTRRPKRGFRYKRSRVARRLRPRPHRQLRHARLCHGGVCFRRGRRAHPHHRRKPPAHRHHRGDGPALRLHRARLRLWPAGHHPGSRASARPRASRRAREAHLRPAEERRDRLRRRHRGRAGPGTGRGVTNRPIPAGNMVLERGGRGACAASSSR